MATLSTLVAQFKSEVGIDAESDSQVEGWLNDAYRELVSRAKWRMAQVVIGTTVSGTAEYALDADVVDIVEGVLVGDAEYIQATQRQLWGLKNGTKRLSGATGAFAPDYSSSGAVQIELWPTPDSSGDSIQALAALMPDTLSSADVPQVPDDFLPAIISGAAFYALSRLDERFDEAQWHRTFFEQKVEELRRRQLGRAFGGPVQIQVSGFHIP